jgi:hypothetical protein
MNAKPTTTSDAQLSPGERVLSADGQPVGTVRAVHGGYFQLAPPLDFWLSDVYVDSVEGDFVRLSIGRREVDEHRLDAPGIEPRDDPHQAINEDHAISPKQALDQRERVERELDKQRARMDDEGGAR